MPEIDTVELDSRLVILHLATPSELPEPWHGADKKWRADLDSKVPESDVLAPYPLLVSIGQDDAGHWWLVDLERLCSVAITGDKAGAEAFVTHVAAELALNPWSVLAATDVIGVAAELAPLDPVRLRHRLADDIDCLNSLRQELKATQNAGSGDPDPFHAVVITPDARNTDDLRAVVDIVNNQTSRTGVAIVTVHADPEHSDSVLEVTGDGHLRVPHLGLDLDAAGLTPDEAQACAAIVDLTRTADIVPIARTDDAAGWRAPADDAGALRVQHTEARPNGRREMARSCRTQQTSRR